MNSVELIAKAKINLSLDVTAKRPDGYHDVRMIMQSVNLGDTVYLERCGSGIDVLCDSASVPASEGNIAYKAAALLFEKYGIKEGLKIRIDKRIPVAAGLAGGSTDAASVIIGINQLFSLEIEEPELMALGKQIGADVPFCIKGGTMLAEGIGEKLTPLTPLPEVDIVLVKPKMEVSTAWVYKNLVMENIKTRPDTDILIDAIDKRDISRLAYNMKNVLETVTAGKYAVIEEIKEKLIGLGALGSMMSGSGPSVFGVFGNRKSAEAAFLKIKELGFECFLTQTA